MIIIIQGPTPNKGEDFEVYAQIGGNLGSVSDRIGKYTYDRQFNGAGAYTNGKFFIFYGGDKEGWQWVSGYGSWAGNGPLLSTVSTAREFVEYQEFSTHPGYKCTNGHYCRSYYNYELKSAVEFEKDCEIDSRCKLNHTGCYQLLLTTKLSSGNLTTNAVEGDRPIS